MLQIRVFHLLMASKKIGIPPPILPLEILPSPTFAFKKFQVPLQKSSAFPL